MTNIFTLLKLNKIETYSVNPIYPEDKVLFILRPDLIGDYICTREFMYMLRQTSKFKSYKFVLCCNLAVKDIAISFDTSCVDEFIFFNPKLLKYNQYLSYLCKNINRYSYDVAINPRTIDVPFAEYIMFQVGANEKYGIEFDKKSDSYTKIYDNNTNEFGANFIDFIKFIANEEIEFSDEGLRPNFDLVEKYDLKEPYAIFFPSASYKDKRMDFSTFYNIANYVKSKNNNYTFYVCGSKDDKKLFKGYNLKENNICDICGKYSLSELFYIFKQANFIVTNETCAVHIAYSVSNYNTLVFNNVYPPNKNNLVVTKDKNQDVVYYGKMYNMYYTYPRCSINAIYNNDDSHLINESMQDISDKDIYFVVDKLLS